MSIAGAVHALPARSIQIKVNVMLSEKTSPPLLQQKICQQRRKCKPWPDIHYWDIVPGGRLQKFLPRCVGWDFSNPPIVVHAKNNNDRPIMALG